jgi:hypothetical protein
MGLSRGRQFADLGGGTCVATGYCSNIAWAVRAHPDGSYTSGRIGEQRRPRPAPCPSATNFDHEIKFIVKGS